MGKNIYISLICITAIVVVFFIVTENKKDNTVGKLKITRPPKIRIVYSKKIKDKDRPKITKSQDAADVFREIWSSQIEVREEFIVLLVDRANRVLGYQLLSKGGITGTVADIKLIYSVVLESLASGIIIAHNHPSGNLQPSNADLQLTKKIQEAGKYIDVALLDHIILTKESYYSFADEGRM
ncbi:MAG: DNA repair protein [Thalassobium sp.]|nr:MAG: DNA repair protein [Thalassobium sp.]